MNDYNLPEEEFFPPDSIEDAEDCRSAIQTLNTVPAPAVDPRASGNNN